MSERVITGIRNHLRETLQSLEVPHLAVMPFRSEFTEGILKQRFLIRIIIGPGDDPATTERLDALLDPLDENGLKKLLEADPFAGDRAQNLTVKTSSGYLEFAEGLGAEWVVEATLL